MKDPLGEIYYKRDMDEINAWRDEWRMRRYFRPRNKLVEQSTDIIPDDRQRVHEI